MNNLISDTKFAIDLEEKGFDYYKQAAAKTPNKFAAITLESLAERELDHIEKIKDFYQRLTGKEKPTDEWLKSIKPILTKKDILKTILTTLQNNLDKEFINNKGVNEVYQIAEGLERDSFNLYDKIARESKDEIVKQFYTAIANEERDHYAILDETLQYLVNPEDWFKKQERWIVEG